MTFPSLCRHIASYVSSVLILLLCLFVGQLAAKYSGGVLPGSIVGMIFLALLLSLGLVKLHWVEAGANFLIRWMALLFVPIGVGLIDNLELLANSLVAILLTCLLGTVLIMALAGWLFQALERRQ
ncbi:MULTISPECIES: CidA/LrgA family protein [Corallincola]|uniref:Murein hydrolase regulator LrgA n=3 Tax=Corallincola TaxID=1775176 RepID=A0A368NK81_9GAMM|nr:MULTISPECIES: CidA/LrgA family protein [Corallincola]RCU50858.1 murein hydrolase regulator LrgA [Corallincola holothuriorum]TAA45817.1 murein hydrolase regulator LrgA [Corallincola spongiicola]TCI03914.1 murein hydrolase regulator LrgA [Corallincola luteus]